MSISIVESGVTFGFFAQSDVFEIEKVLNTMKLGEHVCRVEFIVRDVSDKAAIVFVEAKKTIPRESDDFFADIRVKMINSLTIWYTAVCGRQNQIKPLLPDNLKDFKHLTLPIKMYLVIPEVPDDMLPQLSDKFRKCLTVEQKIWAICQSDISVLNSVRARKYGLVGRV
ncbi:MAG: hypothetical protein HGA87_05005 [Desulfobulbaceae bacterium]|nr:hypothetical protein [Desulfobulbaceae bacterium]